MTKLDKAKDSFDFRSLTHLVLIILAGWELWNGDLGTAIILILLTILLEIEKVNKNIEQGRKE